ncbi:hypothetical protein OEB96_21820 [Paraliomyxa miuraensis]|nr:hypothetical protein [Paraliomyxa miuraensis]
MAGGCYAGGPSVGTDESLAGSEADATGDATGGGSTNPGTTTGTTSTTMGTTSGATTMPDPTTSSPDGSGGPSSTGTSDDGETLDTGEPPPTPDVTCPGYATRYWDCCKPHCSWPGNVDAAVGVLDSCNQGDQTHGSGDVASACNQLAGNSAFTCYSLAPWAVTSDISYGFAAIPSAGDICGRCHRLDFNGMSHNAGADPGSAALAGKSMIVQAVNIGYDVAGGQFDILTPGGGVGAFNACSFQWGVSNEQLGATYGGFLSTCKQQMGGASHDAIKACVMSRCDDVLSGFGDLHAGCEWFVDWFQAADNPALSWGEVECPAAITAVSGMDRTGLGDVQTCDGS